MTKPKFTSRQHAQLKATLALNAARKAVNYDRSADGKAWVFYPCDDHAIRVRKESNGLWYGQLTTMQDRLTVLEHAGPCDARMEAVIKIIKRVL